MDNKNKGLYNKYEVKRTDGSHVGQCFVLELKDKITHSALLEWASSLDANDYHALAQNIRELVNEATGN